MNFWHGTDGSFPLFFAMMCNVLLRVQPFPSLCGVADVLFAVFLHPFTFLTVGVLTFLGSEHAKAEVAPQSAVEDSNARIISFLIFLHIFF